MVAARVLSGVLLLLLCAVRAGAAEHSYRIGAGDRLRILVLGQDDLSATYEVQSDGTVAFPFLVSVPAQGLTAGELATRLTELLADGYLKRPQVAVTVEQSYRSRVFVTGQVARPGPYSLHGDGSLLRLVQDVGELKEQVGHEVVVLRPPEEQAEAPETEVAALPAELAALPGVWPDSQVFRVSLRELLSGHPDRNMLLQAGDMIVFPKVASVYVNGHAVRPGAYRFEEGMTVHRLLALAGGRSARGSSKLRIARIVDGKRKELRVRPADVVQPEDTLIVPERFF